MSGTAGMADGRLEGMRAAAAARTVAGDIMVAVVSWRVCVHERVLVPIVGSRRVGEGGCDERGDHGGVEMMALDGSR